MLEDFFENITLYDNRATEASYEKRDDGKHAVRLQIEARKLHADGGGGESGVALADYVDIGVFGKDGKVLFLEKRHLDSPAALTQTLELVVDEEPREAGIDPFNKLIDRNPKTTGRP